jgi:hypothetical protein
MITALHFCAAFSSNIQEKWADHPPELHRGKSIESKNEGPAGRLDQFIHLAVMSKV